MDLFSDDQRGTAYGLVRIIYMFLGALGPVVTGTLADALGWAVAVGVIGAFLLVAVLAITANCALGIGL